MRQATERERQAALKLEEIMMRVVYLDPASPTFPAELREVGKAFIDVADAMERSDAERKPS